jgi:hypothetical protein
MRYVLSFLLLCILFQNIITTKEYAKRMARASLTLRNIVKNKRKLQQDTTEVTLEDDPIPTTPTDIPQSTAEDAKETLAPAVNYTDDFEMPSDIPVTGENSTETTTTKTSVVQVKKFHKFERKTKIIKFGVFLYFLNKPIVRVVVMRLTIKYKKTGRLRSLQSPTITGESTATTCVIKPEYEEKVGQEGNGDNVDYDCSAATSSEAEIDEAKIDPSKPMVIGNESVPVSEIEFNEDAKDGTKNLVNISNATIGILENTTYVIQDKKLILTGFLKPDTLSLEKRLSLPIDFYDTSINEKKNVYCTVLDFDSSSRNTTIECNTDETPIRTNYGNLTLSSHNSDTLYLTFNIPPGVNNEETINTNTARNTYYRKSSSGLSGGAIAGIVIACVVVLAAASIAAIMLRKPAPPIDNTTVVGLKTVENI